MVSTPQAVAPDILRQVRKVQTVTIAWMSVEAAVSLFAACRARSPALLAFGGDSAIELFSAVVVLWRFRASAAREDVEKRAARVAGALSFALAAFVAVTSVTILLGYGEPKPPLLGIAILVAAAVVMPLACERETAAVRSYRQRSFEGGRRTVGTVRLPLAHRLSRTGDQRDLAGQVGRPDCGFSRSAAYRVGGSGSHAGKTLRLLLVSPVASTQSVVIFLPSTKTTQGFSNYRNCSRLTIPANALGVIFLP